MSDQQGGMSEPETGTSGLDAITGRLNGPGELITAAGAVLILFVDILGDIILEEYSFSYVAWAAALVIVVAVVAQHWGAHGLFASYGRALTVLGLVGGATVARELITDIQFDYLEDGGMTLVMALIFYVGGALLLVGAWQQWSSGDSGS
jgi:hypothetical protein